MVGNIIYMVFSEAKKKEIVFEILQGGITVTSSSKKHGVSRKTLYIWVKRYKKGKLAPMYVSGKKHPKAVYPKTYSYINRWVIANPTWGCRKISSELLKKGIKLSYVQINRVLNVLGAENYDRRVNYARNFAGPGRRKSDVRLEITNKAIEGSIGISALADTYKVARKTIYEWIERYQKTGSVEDAYATGEAHGRSIYPQISDKVLNLVAQNPKYSVHTLKKFVNASSWTIWSILDRNHLNRYDQRLLYSKNTLVPQEEQAQSAVFGREKSVFESFTPNLAPAPPPSGPEALRAGGQTPRSPFNIFLASFLGTSISTLVLIFWYQAVFATAKDPIQFIGLVFATLALVAGTFFFLYSLKYYLTLGIVLSYSQNAERYQKNESGKSGLLSKILGIGGGKIGAVGGNVIGLESDLSRISLDRKPFISVQIPFYNEKNVVRRSIESAINFEYGEYEVILCDDSTDETSSIISAYMKDYLGRGEKLAEIRNDAEGWVVTSIDVKPGVTLKHLHRTTRDGYKGKALDLALKLCDPRTEFVSIFDADFVPYPDTIYQFLRYFKANIGSENYSSSNVAAVQGYQWHVLNKSENWITRGVRSEYAGSYIIERSGAEIYGGLKQISGSVYMIRRDALTQIGWGSSITEDFELTLRLYEKGYKVLYTPYVQAPAECVSTIRRLVRQRMRWAEGHSFNIKKMFVRLMRSPNLTLQEKGELLYLAPYYLQALFFLVGTFAWLISESVFKVRIPFWTEIWGWSLVLTNMISLPLLNSVGLFVEESEAKDYSGIASFVTLSYLLVPFQAYASIKGFLEASEGPWFRTPKTGRITDIFSRGRFYKFIAGILPGKEVGKSLSVSPYLALTTAANNFSNFRITRKKSLWVGKAFLATLLIISNLIVSMAPSVPYFIKPEVAHAQSFDSVDNNKTVQTAPTNNFPDGILVLNTDKSTYKTGETALLQIGYVNKNGDTVCNGNLILNIYTPDQKIDIYTTANRKIQKSSTCSTGNNVTDNPDYLVNYKINTTGTYKYDLSDKDSSYQIKGSFEVKDQSVILVQRSGATRINPLKSTYMMKINVTALRDVSGKVSEAVPAGFKVLDPVSWNINLKKGESKSLKYAYQAPGVSPNQYMLGALSFNDGKKNAPLESTGWNIVADNYSPPAYHMASGSYTGSGNYKQISGLGFAPEAVIVKASTTAGAGALLKTTSMLDNTTAYLGPATADDAAGLITLDTDGFTVQGTNSNAANVDWTWQAWGGSDCSSSGQFCVGDYLGDGTSPRTITTGFQPDIAIVKRSTAVGATFQTVGMSANEGDYFMATAEDNTGVLFGTIQSTGFQVGSTNNTSAGIYHFVAFKKVAGSINVGSFTGNGTSQSISSMGFAPELVITKNINAGTSVSGVFNGADSYGDNSFLFTDTANSVGSITSLDSNGFSVGSNSMANGSGNTIYWLAFNANSTTVNSSGTFKIASGTYTGNGNYQNFNGLGFAPDLVIIKGDTAQAGVFRTTQLGGDTTAYLDSATADFAGGITSLNPDGFAIGTAAQVNSNGVSYYWTAYGNAWRTATNSGASDFTVGTYYGNGIDSRNITGLPFQPDLVVIKRAGASAAVFRTSQNSGDQSAAFAATAEAANKIQGFNSDGFQIGTDATVNTAANLYRYFAFKTGSNFAVGTYSGSGSTQDITSVGFQPDNIWIKATAATRGVERTSDMATNSALPFINAANVTNAVTGILSNGFTVNSAAETNSSGTNNYRYVAWKKTNTVSTPSYNFAQGRYVGSGNYKKISGLGFTPEAVIIKASTTAGVGAMLKTASMIDNSTSYLGSATADDANGLITLDTDGFTVVATNANAANVSWTWAAWGGSNCSSGGQFCIGDYLGDGSVPRTITTGFQPDISIVKRSTNAVAATFQTVGMSANEGEYFMATAEDTTGVLFGTIQSTGFQVGSTNDVSAGIYHYVAIKKNSSNVNVGSFSGNGTSQSIGSMGFAPDFVITKNINAGTPVSSVYNGADSYGDSSFYFTDTANVVGGITSLDSNGFSVGSNSVANGSGNTIYWMGFYENNHTVSSSGTFKMASGTYVGNGNYQNFNGLGFAPDLVIIKGDTAQAGVFRTTQHNGDATSYLDSATADFAGGITTLNPDGFSIGTAAQVNSSSVNYYWTAYGNAWRPATNSGASDFVIGTYYGNGIDSRNITGLPFQPDLVVIKRSGASAAVFRTSQNSGDQAAAFAATAEAANKIQAFNSDGFQIGTDATVNTAANFYRYFAFKSGSNFVVGTYSGNGTSQNISSVGFQPNNLWIKATAATRGIQHTGDMSSTAAIPFINVANVSSAISGLLSDGFSLGNAAETNSSGTNNYRYVAWKIPGITVSSSGTQTTNLAISSTANYIGAAFTFTGNASAVDLTSITVSETGTINAQTNLANAKFYYETAATCTYNGSETQFGSTQSFNGSDKATFTGIISVGSSQVCGYVVFDVGSGASVGQTIELEITSSTDVTPANGPIYGTFAVALSGTTTIVNAITNSSQYSFQRKTWYDGTRYWKSYATGNEIQFWYSTDGSSWTQNTSATITVTTSDFSIEADTSNAFIIYTNGFNIDTRSASSYPGTGFSWGSATTIFTGSGSTDEYTYPVITRDSSNYVWVGASYSGNGIYYYLTAKSNSANNITAWGSNHYLSDTSNTSTNVYGNLVPTGSQNMYATFVNNTTLSGCKWVNSSTMWQNTGGSSCETDLYSNGLVGYWKMNESSWNGTSNEVVDSSAYSHPGTAQGNATTTSSGKFNNAGTFDGNGDYVQVADHADFDITGDFTLSAWVARAAGANGSIISKTNDASDGGYSLLHGNSGEVYCRTVNGSGHVDSYTATGYINADSTWHHVLAVRSGTSCRIWIDGVDRTSNAGTHTSMTANNNNLELGSAPNGSQQINGKIDDARIYNRALNNSEIAALYAYTPTSVAASRDSIATVTSGLSTTISTVADASGNVHLTYIDSSGHTVYSEYTSSWQTSVTLDSNSTNTYPSISLDTSSGNVYAFWIRSGHIYYKGGVSPYLSGNWDASATDWHTGTNLVNLTSNVSGNGKAFAEWTSDASSPYTINWDVIVVPENLWFLFSLGIVVPFYLRKKRKASSANIVWKR